MKLHGIRVIDLTNFLPGPYLSLEMADHGAEVIKVEQPGEGDPGRHIGLADGPHTVFFRNLNRGKKSIVLDLKTDEGRAALFDLVESADVFLESFRPGVAERLGFDYESLRARNPGLVYCSISAFGQDGPYASRPAHDLAVEALTGVLSLNVGRDGSPAIPGVPVADLLAGLQGLSGVLMALLRRQTTGKGDRIDISMMDCMAAALRNVLGPTFAEGRQPDPKLERTTGGSAFYRIYETSDGGRIALAGQEPKFIHALLAALERPDLAPLCLRGPGAHQQPLTDFLEQTFRQRTRRDWEERLSSLDVCFGPVNTLPEALQDPHLLARGMVLRDAEGRPHIASPIRFLDEPAEYDLDSPALDQHHHLLDELKS
ncbi:CaiB/BaiF CoA-transferase family protein [Variovorax sp. Sphag1AA]|uniref:CaiB/BaiF CoA transferase family protein n=1 Tax=Variovorax sp. Sphag1AA TaxID=2587027 RepID=UPI001619B306|nr:CoA transferase [Variovorax sp. Sphag1AA]MBB3180922.1 crotonobetainyl-CoA:carnitine CoA-transferase CaiB-like acyl-CoA transferase [Variovorax sp. Sphag1AA]